MDDPPSGPQCEAIRKGIIYGGDAPLFWTLGFGGGIILSIRLRFWRVSSESDQQGGKADEKDVRFLSDYRGHHTTRDCLSLPCLSGTCWSTSTGG